MKKNLILILMALGLVCNVLAKELAQFVNPFIGTVPGSGNTYPGAQVPFGMISWSPQTLDPSAVGYNYNTNRITGFGLVHSSGVGCGAACELPFIPTTMTLGQSPVTNSDAYSSTYSHTNEMASPGFYSVRLSSAGISFETTVKARSGIAHFDFPETSAASVIFNPNANANGVWDGAIQIDPMNQSICGWVKSGGFCQSTENNYTVYFSARFDRPVKSFGIWQNEVRKDGVNRASGNRLASYITFDCSTSRRVAMKVGISFVSISNAQLNLDQEIPDWDFASVKAAARADWNKQLSRIQVEGGLNEDKTIFYTALYHSLMLPSIFEDVNGEYRGMDDQVHAVSAGHHQMATFSGWDTYRTQAQLWGLLYPEMASDVCSSFLAMSRQSKYKGGGGLPLWSLFNDETRIMIGYPADAYIANAYAFGATNFDLMALKEVMVDSGKNERWCGRNVNVTWEFLSEYKKYGFCPDDLMPAACSRNVEYSVADFAVGQFCEALGDSADAAYFIKRSQGVFNLINPQWGYLQRKKQDGTWVTPFDRFSGDGFTEGNSAHYTWTIPHSLKKLIQLAGGKEKAEAKLDELTSQLANGYDYNSKYYEAGNEPCFGVMPVYNWLAKPWKAQEKIRTVLMNCFSDKSNGIPGDDDSGAMSAWYVFAAIGLYPEIPGVGGFTVLSPLFPKTMIQLPNGKFVKIVAKNASRTSKFIQSMKINGNANSKLWLPLGKLESGASIDFKMGSLPNTNWGVSDLDVPPSLEPDPQ